MGRPGAAPKRRTRSERAARQQAQAQRRAAGLPEATPKPERPAGWLRAQMSYWGMAGGFWATSTFALLALLVLVDPKGHSRALAAVYAAIGLAFVPAIVYSMLPSRRREMVLRLETALCMAFAFFGLFVIGDIGLPILLSAPTIMLATGAGLVFPGARKKDAEEEAKKR